MKESDIQHSWRTVTRESAFGRDDYAVYVLDWLRLDVVQIAGGDSFTPTLAGAVAMGFQPFTFEGDNEDCYGQAIELCDDIVPIDPGLIRLQRRAGRIDFMVNGRIGHSIPLADDALDRALRRALDARRTAVVLVGTDLRHDEDWEPRGLSEAGRAGSLLVAPVSVA